MHQLLHHDGLSTRVQCEDRLNACIGAGRFYWRINDRTKADSVQSGRDSSEYFLVYIVFVYYTHTFIGRFSIDENLRIRFGQRTSPGLAAAFSGAPLQSAQLDAGALCEWIVRVAGFQYTADDSEICVNLCGKHTGWS